MTHQLWVGVVGIVLALSIFVVFQWWEHRRFQRVKAWIDDFLTKRDGVIPAPVHINCTGDRRWPVLVSYDRPATQTRHNLQFHCSGVTSKFALLSEKEERREGRAGDSSSVGQETRR